MDQITQQSIGILLISTWKYNKFIDDTITGIRKYFFPNSKIKIFLHTDSKQHHDADIIVPLEHRPWPLVTLFRFDKFHKNINLYDTDYIFYLDIDTNIIDKVEEDILDDLCVVKHGCFPNSRGTPETNPKSMAFIKPEEDIIYVCGGFFGGKNKCVKNLITILSTNIQKDYDNNIIAVWHDESHLNRYIQSYKNIISTTFLDPGYMKFMTCGQKHTNIKMIAYSNETKGFNKFYDKNSDRH